MKPNNYDMLTRLDGTRRNEQGPGCGWPVLELQPTRRATLPRLRKRRRGMQKWAAVTDGLVIDTCRAFCIICTVRSIGDTDSRYHTVQ